MRSKAEANIQDERRQRPELQIERREILEKREGQGHRVTGINSAFSLCEDTLEVYNLLLQINSGS